MTEHISNAHEQAVNPFGDPSPRIRAYFHDNPDLPTDLLRFVTAKARPLFSGDPEEVVNGLIEMFLTGVVYEQDRFHRRHGKTTWALTDEEREAMNAAMREQLRGIVGGEEQE